MSPIERAEALNAELVAAKGNAALSERLRGVEAKLAEAQDQITAYEGGPDWKRLYRETEAKLAAAIKDADETTAIMAEANAGILKQLRTAEAQARELQAKHDEVRAICEQAGVHHPAVLLVRLRELRAALEAFAERDCEYGDGCPDFGTRHGACVGCKARKVLARTDPTSVQSGAGE